METIDRLIVLGAGAKAVALSAKTAVLRDLGHPAPEILVVEPADVASAWTAAGGMTSGDLLLGTTPEKDVGFPYLSGRFWPGYGAADAQMHHRFSWASYLILRGSYQEWIDRGKPHPTHSAWGGYLKWVSGESGMCVLRGVVTNIELSSTWAVHVASEKGAVVLSGNGLVITGYGTVPTTEPVGETPESFPGTGGRHIDVAAFWHRARANLLPMAGRIVVVGAGEAAAGIVEHLQRMGRYDVAVVCSDFAIYTRGESFYENELYSNPDRWQEFPLSARKMFIDRTDRGVFSVKALSALATLDRVEIIGGRVVDVQECGTWAEVTVDRLSEKVQCRADLVIDACGRDAAWFLQLMSDSVMAPLMDALGGQVNGRGLTDAVTHDLSICGLYPRLHVPNLAGPLQGPGFPAMTCLGLLSDRILRSYLPSC